MDNKIAFAAHGGASSGSISFKKEHEAGYREAMKMSANAAWKILEAGGKAIEAVQSAVVILEDNGLFNCGKGSALNCKGQIEMDALIVDGHNLKSGAITMVRNIKNPINLAKEVMLKTNCLLLGGAGAMDFARQHNIELKSDAYFFTEHQLEQFKEERNKPHKEPLLDNMHGTVGAVARDKYGNLASAVSTGGTCMKQEGRIGDTPLLGVGGYADNHTCAAAATGDGEIIMRNVLTYSLSCLLATKKFSVQEACDYLLHTKNKDVKGDIGLISIDATGNIGIAFNSTAMPRAWQSDADNLQIEIF